MFLSRLELNPRIKEVRRDLASPYEMHSTLHRAFSQPIENSFLWREERMISAERPVVIVQSILEPDWKSITVRDYFGQALTKPFALINNLHADHRFRFRLRANPVVTKKVSDDKADKRRRRVAILDDGDLRAWLARQGETRDNPGSGKLGGFELMLLEITGKDKIKTTQRSGSNGIVLFGITFEGVLRVTDVEAFRNTIRHGLGKGKAFGLGMLSVAPAPERG